MIDLLLACAIAILALWGIALFSAWWNAPQPLVLDRSQMTLQLRLWSAYMRCKARTLRWLAEQFNLPISYHLWFSLTDKEREAFFFIGMTAYRARKEGRNQLQAAKEQAAQLEAMPEYAKAISHALRAWIHERYEE
jgi:hypothetical protein